MRPILRHAGFAFLAWLLPFAISVAIFPIRESHPPLFESLIAVVLATSTVILFRIESRRVTTRHLSHGIGVGCLWMAANWLLDAPMFSAGPMKMTLAQYIIDIGVTYLMIPVITTGMAAGNTQRRGAEEFAEDAENKSIHE